MATTSPCPFCGGRLTKMRPFLNVAKIGIQVAGTGASLRTRKSGRPYLGCDGCSAEFVPAERDIRNILSGLRVEQRVLPRIRLYHGEGVTVTDLLTEHRTAIVKRVRRYRSYVSVSVPRNEILICFCCGGVRTYGTFARRSKRSGYGDHYVFKELNKA